MPTPEELLAVPPPLQMGEISQMPSWAVGGPMLGAPAPAPPPAPAPALPAAAPTAEGRILSALGGEAALQAPQEWQAGAPPGFALPKEALRTATGGELPPSALPRFAQPPPGAEPYAGRQFGEIGAPVRTGETVVETALQSDTSARAQELMGPGGADLVAQLRAQGVPEETIRQRLGLRVGPAPGGMGGMRRDPAELQPPELRAMNPAPGLYMPGYRAALQASDIDPKAKEQLLARYDEWARTDPRAVELTQHEMGLEFAEKERGFQRQQQEAEQRQLEAQREIETQRAEKAKLDATQFRDFKADYDKRYGELERDYARTIEQLKQTKVDPRRGSIPIIDALALALGAAGAAFTKGPNFAQQLITDRTNNDIQAQLADISTLKDTAAAQRNRLGMLRERFGDTQTAILFEQKLQLDAAKAYLGQRKAEAGSELARIDAARYEAEVDQAISNNQAEFDKKIRVSAILDAEERARQRAAAAYQQSQQRKKQQQIAEMQATGLGPVQTKGYEDMAKRHVKGLGFVADPKDREMLNTIMGASSEIKQKATHLKYLISQPGYRTSPTMQRMADALGSDLKFASKELLRAGAFDAGLAKELEQQIPTGGTFDIGTAGPVLDQTIRNVEVKRDTAIRQYDVTPGEVGVYPDPETGMPQQGFRIGTPGYQPQQQQVQQLEHQAQK